MAPDVEQLLKQYIERFESGGSTDPSDLLSQAEGRDRARLRALIEGYLETEAPVQKWDAEAFEGSVAERAVARLSEEWAGASGELPSTLVELRKQRQISRKTLVKRLADALGVADKTEKVEGYYHRLEWGTLDASKVAGIVYGELAGLLDTSAEALRKAGQAATPASEDPTVFHAYARIGKPDPEYADAEDAGAAAPGRSAEPPPEEPDEVDRLFTGGD